MNIPNRLTLLRICMIPLFVTAYFLPFKWGPIVAVCLFILAALTDMLDGYIARKYHLVTDLGKLLDPVADKILSTAAMFCIVATNPLQWLSCFAGGWANFNWTTFGYIFFAVAATLILARELLIDGVRMIAASKGVVLQANIFGKIKTVLQDVSLPFLVFSNFVKYIVAGQTNVSNGMGWFVFDLVAVVLFGLAVVMTVVSGTIYLVKNSNVFTQDKN